MFVSPYEQKIKKGFQSPDSGEKIQAFDGLGNKIVDYLKKGFSVL